MSEKLATFGGGCFWCMVEPFDTRPGVLSVVSGYSGGDLVDPTYQDVKSQTSGHVEVVQIKFDDTIMTYEELLGIYWQVVDPTDAEGQFVDRGESYRPVIFYHDSIQKEQAEKSKAALDKSGKFDKPIVVAIEPFKNFYVAEDYHQDFYKKNPGLYHREEQLSGRHQFYNK